MAAWQAVPNPELPPAPPPGWDPRLLWLTLALVLIILCGAVLLVWLDRWRKRSEARPLDASEQLAQFRELYEDGELSQREYDRIRSRLTGELRKELNVPPAPPKDPVAEPAPPPEQPGSENPQV